MRLAHVTIFAAAVTAGSSCGEPPAPVVSPTPLAATTGVRLPAPPPPGPSHPPPTCPLPMSSPAPIADPHVRNPFSRIDKPPHGGRCETADSNLARVEAEILRAHAEAMPSTTRTLPPWDHRKAPVYVGLVSKRLALATDEFALLDRQGFVVLPRMKFQSYAAAFHEIYQSQLPIYISIDAVLDAIYAGNDAVIADVEDRKLAPLLEQVLDKLACKLALAKSTAPVPEPYLPEQVRDLDVYLAVARALATDTPPTSMFGDPAVEAEARQLVAAAIAGDKMATVSLFGRDRVIDFTAFTPRGHYAANDARKRFFRAATWASRIELNLVSRSSRSSQPGTTPDPSETPREDLDALALADLVVEAGARDDLALLDEAWTLFSGRREDVPIEDLEQLRIAAGIVSPIDKPEYAAQLRATIADRYQRTARTHYMPEGATSLPVIATLLGPRIAADAQATRPLVHDELPDRNVLHAGDVAYALGHDRALGYLADDRAKFSTLEAQLTKARGIIQTAPRGAGDLYSAWLDAIVGLAQVPTGARPSFMATPAYADLRANSALAAYGELKHNYVLMAGQSYFAGGCDIPDGYVEPAPVTYRALEDYTARGLRVMQDLDSTDSLGTRAYYERVGEILGILDEIELDELAGVPLTADEKSFLSMVAEITPGTTGNPATYTGWWFDLFRDREIEGLARADFIASFFTGKSIAYVGSHSPSLGVFVIDTGGPPRLAVGPVADAYEYQGEVAHRLDDVSARALPASAELQPWAASFTAGGDAPEPTVQLMYPAQDTKHRLDVQIEAKSDLGPVTVELLDHHRVALAKATQTIGAGLTYVTFPGAAKLADKIEGVHLKIGRYQTWRETSPVEGGVYIQLGGYAQ